MGILVICSYRPKPGRADEARSLMNAHLPLLRTHGLVTARPGMRGMGKDGVLMEIFEWDSMEKSWAAPTIPEIGAHWKKMADAMDFIGLASLPETQTPFAHFSPLD